MQCVAAFLLQLGSVLGQWHPCKGLQNLVEARALQPVSGSVHTGRSRSSLHCRRGTVGLGMEPMGSLPGNGGGSGTAGSRAFSVNGASGLCK